MSSTRSAAHMLPLLRREFRAKGYNRLWHFLQFEVNSHYMQSVLALSGRRVSPDFQPFAKGSPCSMPAVQELPEQTQVALLTLLPYTAWLFLRPTGRLIQLGRWDHL